MCMYVYKLLADTFLYIYIMMKATGGGAFKFADLFKEKLDISLDKVEEMSSLVSGANFLLKVKIYDIYIFMIHFLKYLLLNIDFKVFSE